MPKHKKTGWYEHFCVLIFAQGKWNEKDRESVINPIQEKRKENLDYPYPFFTKLTLRRDPPHFAKCELCENLHSLFEELKGSNDAILYQGHHYLIFEDDKEDMKELVNIILSNEKVKKFYLVYIKGFSELKTTKIRAMDLNELKVLLPIKKVNKTDFIDILEENKFEKRIVYEVSRY